jgi:hypothetical protein
MLETLVTVVIGLVVGVAAFAAAFLLGMRTRSPLVQRPVIWLGRVVLNKIQMRTAGSPGAYAAVIRHRGRRTGAIHETPVGAVAVEDGFVIALPYGTEVQWLRNVCASGSATLVHEGRTYAVDRPEIVPMATVEAAFSPADQRTHRLFRVDACVRLHQVEDALPEHRGTATVGREVLVPRG